MSAVVLVVDDDPVQRRLIENMVQRFGYKALTADGGDAAHKRVHNVEINAILGVGAGLA